MEKISLNLKHFKEILQVYKIVSNHATWHDIPYDCVKIVLTEIEYNTLYQCTAQFPISDLELRIGTVTKWKWEKI